jgi:hypothetical protein
VASLGIVPVGKSTDSSPIDAIDVNDTLADYMSEATLKIPADIPVFAASRVVLRVTKWNYFDSITSYNTLDLKICPDRVSIQVALFPLGWRWFASLVPSN